MANRWDKRNFFKRNTSHFCYGCLEQQQTIPVSSHQALHALTALSRLHFHPPLTPHSYQAIEVHAHTHTKRKKKKKGEKKKKIKGGKKEKKEMLYPWGNGHQEFLEMRLPALRSEQLHEK